MRMSKKEAGPGSGNEQEGRALVASTNVLPTTGSSGALAAKSMPFGSQGFRVTVTSAGREARARSSRNVDWNERDTELSARAETDGHSKRYEWVGRYTLQGRHERLTPGKAGMSIRIKAMRVCPLAWNRTHV